MNNLYGNCECRAVCYELGDIKSVLNCHCTLCRKLTGAAFASYIIVLEQDLKLLKGETFLSNYCAQGTTATKFFCKVCGSPIYNKNPKYPGVNIVYLGTLAETYHPVPKINIYCDNKLNWLENLFDIESLPEGIKR
ncbi:MAG TPA: GFA family protein [Gammaproteobacteria bacterium]|nr:GFA family protein [Gammaproteobacteria bacterium]